MYLKVAIECQKCGCSFELRPKLFKNPDSFECPNCGQQIPEEIAHNLKTGLIALGKVPYAYPTEAPDVFREDGFTFQVKELSDSNSFTRFGELEN